MSRFRDVSVLPSECFLCNKKSALVSVKLEYSYVRFDAFFDVSSAYVFVQRKFFWAYGKMAAGAEKAVFCPFRLREEKERRMRPYCEHQELPCPGDDVKSRTKSHLVQEMTYRRTDTSLMLYRRFENVCESTFSLALATVTYNCVTDHKK